MLRIEDIKSMNVEVSSKCIARCPFCSRSQKIRPYGAFDLSPVDFKRLPDTLYRSLRNITFAGNFGDLSSNRHMPQIALHVKTQNPGIRLGGETHGSKQKPSWWQALGPAFADGCMEFALDGLEDTHYLHRVGTDFNQVIANMKAFIAGGGKAHWKFIVFAHNEHQITAAQKMAADIGCQRFFVLSSRDYDRNLSRPQTVTVDIKRNVFRAYAQGNIATDNQVICRSFTKGSLYIAADGTVHPCCLAHLMYVTEHNNRFRFIVPLIEKYRHAININTTELQDIITGPYFAEIDRLSRSNAYCRSKCHPMRQEIREKLVLADHAIGR